MAAALKRPQLMTVDAFLDWDSPGPYVWQLVDGQPMAMAPGDFSAAAVGGLGGAGGLGFGVAVMLVMVVVAGKPKGAL